MSVPVHFAPASLARGLRAGLERRRLTLADLNGNTVTDGPALLEALGQALAFPAYYGANWDAAEECLRELGERYPQGYALVIDHAAALWQRLPREMGQLVSLWLAVSDALAEAGISLQLVFLLESKR